MPKRYSEQGYVWAPLIRSLRSFLGLIQADLAERLGVRVPTVWRWEHGQSLPHPNNQEKILQLCRENHFDTSPFEVLPSPKERIQAYRGEDEAIFDVIKEQYEHDPVAHIYIDQPVPGVYIVALTKRREIVLLHQYRYPLERLIWEIPAGGKRHNESLEDAARRELEEESGYKAGKLEKLLVFHPSPGLTSSTAHLFLATELSRGKRSKEPESRRIVEVRTVDFLQARNMIRKGEITQAGAIIGILYVADLFRVRES